MLSPLLVWEESVPKPTLFMQSAPVGGCEPALTELPCFSLSPSLHAQCNDHACEKDTQSAWQYRIIKIPHGSFQLQRKMNVRSPQVSVLRTFVIPKCQFKWSFGIPRFGRESVLLTPHESNPSEVHRQIGLLAAVNTPPWVLEQEKIWCWLNVFMCGCRTAIHFYDNREGFGWGNEERNGGWRQEIQSGGSGVELTAAVDHFTQAFQSLRGLPAFCLICKAASPLYLCQQLNI